MSLLIRLGISLLMVLFGFVSYCTNTSENPITGETQRVQLTPQQEIQLGRQARSQMAQEFGGLYPEAQLQQYLDEVGGRVVSQSIAAQSPYPYEFHLLRDPKTINAFALPGGQVFITAGLMRQLNSEAQLAAVLGHEIGHVVARHGAEHLAKQQLGQSLVYAVTVAAGDTQDNARKAAIIARMVNELANLRYGREDELESDRLGFEFMTEAGYNPEGSVELMQVLQSSREGNEPPEFFSSHPNPSNRIDRLQELIAQNYPNGVPPELEEGQQEFSQTVRSRLPSGG